MRIYKITFIFIVGVFSLFSCSSDDKDDSVPFDADAKYKVTVSGNWTSATHPTNYPSNSHFSPVIGMSHKNGTNFFQAGHLASAGIENMAETGGTSPLDNEIRVLINSGGANQLIKTSGLNSGSAEITFDLVMSKDFPLVTLVSMVAPSPDWFIAIENVNLYANNDFINELTVFAESYDSGTDSGLDFTSANDDTDPAGNIFKITSPPLGNGTSVTPHLVSVTFKKITVGM